MVDVGEYVVFYGFKGDDDITIKMDVDHTNRILTIYVDDEPVAYASITDDVVKALDTIATYAAGALEEVE